MADEGKQEAWAVACQKWAEADPCEIDDAHVFRAGYAAAVRDAMATAGRYFWTAFDHRDGAFNPLASTNEQEYARKIRDDIAKLMPSEPT